MATLPTSAGDRGPLHSARADRDHAITRTPQPARAVTAREGVGSFACLRLPRRFLIDASADPSGGFEQQLHSREKAPDNPPELVITFG